MKTKFAIIGGGLAGLCAAIHLTELGEEPIVIEGGIYPAHKICGEFLSPECLSTLHRWEIAPVNIPQLVLKTTQAAARFSFPSPAGGMTHTTLAPALAYRAALGGAALMTSTQVSQFQPKQHPGESHQITLSTGVIIKASHALIATGKIPSYSKPFPSAPYFGFKAHFKDIPSDGNLEMFSLPGAYLGIAPVGDNLFNVAGLAKYRQECSTPQYFIDQLISQHPELSQILSSGQMLFKDWMTTSLPPFGVRETPPWLDCYFIGDAAATIPPACGDGLSMAIIGGCLAAEFAAKGQPEAFKQMWTKRCSSQIMWGKLIHQLMLTPSLGNLFLRLNNVFPMLMKRAFALTRTAPCS